MDELRKNNNVIIELSDKTCLEASIFDYTFDRVMIEIKDEFIKEAKKINELDELEITADTHLGFKKMNSSVISPLDDTNKMIVENNPAYIVITNREFSRVKTSIDFKITKDKHKYNAVSIDISGNGLGFRCDETVFKIDDEVEIELKLKEDEPAMTIKAVVVKTNSNVSAVKYKDLKQKFQDNIVKYVFVQSTKK